MLVGYFTCGVVPFLVVTYENNYAEQKSWIINPGVTVWKLSEGSSELALFGIDVNTGPRFYLGKSSSGIYLQSLLALGYASIDVSSADDEANASGFGGGLLGYVGTKGKWDRVSMFIDVGLGYQFSGLNFDSSVDSDLEGSVSATGLALDLNFGIGYSF
jgi:hypothetical protein